MDKKRFDENKIEKFLLEHKICRFATTDAKGQPHVVPVWYIYDRENFYIITNYNTKKYRNLLENKMVSLVIDDYPIAETIEGICVLGMAEIIENGEKYRHVLKLIQQKYPTCNKYYPIGEGKAPIIKIRHNGYSIW